MEKHVKRAILVTIAAVALVSMAASELADARLGGSKSFGVQRPSIAPRAATPPASTASGAASQPVMPAQPGATLPAKPLTPPVAAPSGASRWLGPLAGIAAGLGLAALLSHFGLPEGFGSFLLLALLAVGVIFVARMLFARRTPPSRPLAFDGGSNASAPAFEMPPAPQWGGATRIEPTLASSLPPSRTVYPPGFDADNFARHAKEQFVRLQAAYDAGDRKMLTDVMTPEMIGEIAGDLDSGGTRLPTRVDSLEAEVFDVETQGDRHWASVRFSGKLREGGSAPIAFDEVWNLTKPADGSTGWLLAGIQQTA